MPLIIDRFVRTHSPPLRVRIRILDDDSFAIALAPSNSDVIFARFAKARSGAKRRARAALALLIRALNACSSDIRERETSFAVVRVCDVERGAGRRLSSTRARFASVALVVSSSRPRRGELETFALLLHDVEREFTTSDERRDERMMSNEGVDRVRRGTFASEDAASRARRASEDLAIAFAVRAIEREREMNERDVKGTHESRRMRTGADGKEKTRASGEASGGGRKRVESRVASRETVGATRVMHDRGERVRTTGEKAKDDVDALATLDDVERRLDALRAFLARETVRERRFHERGWFEVCDK